jgi:glutathione S-transferase
MLPQPVPVGNHDTYNIRPADPFSGMAARRELIVRGNTPIARTLTNVLRWLVYYGSCFEPAVVDRAMKREPGALAMVPYGDYDTMLNTLTGQLAKGPYLLGERISAADVLWGTALTWTTMFKLVPELPVIKDYIGRINARPAVGKVKALDAKLAAEHEAAAKQAVAS